MAPPKRRPVLVLNKTEWDRITRAAEPIKPPWTEKSDYLQKLNERSREWVKRWPDSVEGVVAKVRKFKENKQQRERDMVVKYKEIERLKTLIDNKAVEKAKQQIFDDSCYGKQLISALLESKVIEEREAQIELNKKLKQEALQLAKEQELMNTLQVGLEDESKILKRREVDKQFAEEYKAIVEENKKKQSQEKQKEILGELEDARLMKQLLDIEPHDMDDCKRKAIEAAQEHIADQKYYRKLKEIRQKEDDALVQVWKKYHDRVRCREKQVMDKIHKERQDVPHIKLTYELVEKLHDEEQKRYDEFIDKGVKKLEQRSLEKDEKETKKRNQIKEQFLQYAKDNKLYGELLKSYCHANKFYSDRQTLAMKKTNKIKYGKDNVKIDQETSQSSPKAKTPIYEMNEPEKEQEPCKNSPSTENSFTDASSLTGSPGIPSVKSSKASIKSLKSEKFLSNSSTETSTSFNDLMTITPSLKSSKESVHRSIEVKPSRKESINGSPSSLKWREMGSLDVSIRNKNSFSGHKQTIFNAALKGDSASSDMKSCTRKCGCARKDFGIKELKENKNEMEVKNVTEPLPSFLKPRNKLVEALKQREKEPSPWTGLTETHQYFAKQASGILSECRYKKMAQKVVNEYKKVNRLDTLPISNWN